MKVRSVFLIGLFLVPLNAAFAQEASEVLASANGRTFTAQDLDPAVAKAWVDLPQTIRNARVSLLDQHIERTMLFLEAKAKGTDIDALIEDEVIAKVPDPSEKEIRDLYDANKPDVGAPPLEEIRDQIVEYLRQQPEKEAYAAYIAVLKDKFDVSKPVDINSKGLSPDSVVATVGESAVSYAEYRQRNGLALYELEANITDSVLESLTQVVDAAVYTSEAQTLGIATSSLIANEITDKMKTYSDREREDLETALKARLYPKYKVSFFIQEVTPYLQTVSADDDPFTGNARAPVTIVMFSDFQCPACAGVHPVLKRVAAEFGNSVRVVVRDFPLTKVHENAFRAAVAANAANRQNKFFPFIELLYDNQEDLDDESLLKYAEAAGLNVEKFAGDLNNEAYAEEVRSDIEDGKTYGVSGTPSIFVNGYKIRSLSAKSFRKAIRKALAVVQ